MSRFYASIQGSRGEATRQGTCKSGMVGHIRGWKIGACVEMRTAKDNPDDDDCLVTITHGSRGRGNELFLGVFRIIDGQIKRVDKPRED